MPERVVRVVSHMASAPFALIVAALLIGLGAALGPLLGFKDGWAAIIGAAVTCLTFLMILVVHYSGQQSIAALETKLDKVIQIQFMNTTALSALRAFDPPAPDQPGGNADTGRSPAPRAAHRDQA